ncbi:unnamed protein product [Kuraishia capsulata CBS 1993]|uniref:Leucine carboxyl methyltransferase 1 n=1 Tax=Kuraishia capsulata CBS 1993 TaxID=1382522 RepID=W6MKY7_9ASCO|nr:uncharacterized protein KUCA_T00002712001 [Kuraishia capsulata CBS 1993]CDK26738.1 unnamed protein product [Kuraishia capsulata CBS 1993]
MVRTQDDVIRSTDLDALSCRVACVSKGYLEDEFLKPIVSGLIKFQPLYSAPNTQFVVTRNLKKQLFQAKLPIISRGSYIRVKSIDCLVDSFLSQHEGTPCQIVSLGSGSETRPFKLLPKYPELNYVEIDFAKSVKVKKYSILADAVLRSRLGVEAAETIPSTYDEFAVASPDLHTENYHLFSLDLRSIDRTCSKQTLEDNGVKFDVPTLILSECVLCYLEPEDSNRVLSFFLREIPDGSVIVYEPMGGEGDDNGKMFGKVMEANLATRNISLPSLFTFGTLARQSSRFERLGIKKVKCLNMETIFDNWISPETMRRISRLELLDETEEWKLLSEHYCLCYCTWGSFAIDKKISM